MTSEVAICNQALVKVGASRITALSDDTKQARALNAIYAVKRDAHETLSAQNILDAFKASRLITP